MISEMITWFGQQDSAVQAAIIAGMASIIVALIAAISKLVTERPSSKKKEDKAQRSATNIKQTAKGSNNILIGIQNNKEDKYE